MLARMKKILAIIPLVVACGGGTSSQAPVTSTSTSAEISVGKPAPAFSLVASDGTKLDSAALAGKFVVLYFYPKDETSGCTTEACAFRDAWDTLQKSGVVLVGISVDTDESHRAFAEHHKLPFHLVSDAKLDLAKRFGVSSKYIDKLGATIEMRETIVIGKDGNVLKIYRTVDPTKHAAEIESDLGLGGST
jgi:thioredoxin-dependent peroxiredoxin